MASIDDNTQRDNYLSGLDVEMDADMSAILNKDPLARLGYRDVNFDYGDTVSPSDNYNAYYNREENLISYDSATGASEDVIAHEARHAGTKKVYDLYSKDPDKFIDMFGPEAARIIKYQPTSDELIVEFRDDPDATWPRPVGEGEVVTTNFSDTIQSEIPQDLRDMKFSGIWREAMQSENRRSIESGKNEREDLGDKEDISDSDWMHYYPEEYRKGQDGLYAAALHLLNEDGEPPQFKKLNPNAIDNYEKPFPSWWDKTKRVVKNTLSPEGDHYPDIGAISKGYNKGGSVEDNTQSDNQLPSQDVGGTGTLTVTASPSGNIRDVNEDTFNPLGNSTDMWRQAGEYFMGAGRNADIKPDDGIITAGAKHANDYYGGMSMAALTGAEAVYQSAASILTNLVLPGMDDEQEKRLQKDVFAMPDAFLGTTSVNKIDDFGEAFGTAATGISAQLGTKLDNLSPNTLGSNLGNFGKIPEGLSNRITKFSRKGEEPNSTSKLPAFVDSLTIPEKGIKGSNVIKSLEAHPDIRTSSVNLEAINKGRLYTREDLEKVFEGNQSVTDFQETSAFSNDQRQLGVGFMGKEKDYSSVAININTGDSPSYRVKGRVHYKDNTAAHLRFSEVSSSYLPTQNSQFDEFNSILRIGPNKPKVRMIVNDEVQSDALRQGTYRTLNDTGKEKVIDKEFDKRANGRLSRNLSPLYYKTDGGFNREFGSYNPIAKGDDNSNEIVRIYKNAMHDMRKGGNGIDSDSLYYANSSESDFRGEGAKLFKKVRNDISDGKNVSEDDLIHLVELRTRRDPGDIETEDYLDAIDSVVEEIDQSWMPTILRGESSEFKSTYDQLPNIGTARISQEQGNVRDAIKDYTSNLARELMFKHNKPEFQNHSLISGYREAKSKFSSDLKESLARVDENGLLSRYAEDPEWINDAIHDYTLLQKNSKSPTLDKKFAKSPLSNVRQIQDESISVMIQNASNKGIDYIVLPKVNAMYKARPEINIEKDNMLNRMYDYDESLKGFKETYPSLKIHRNVKAPYLVKSEKAKDMHDKLGIELGGENVKVGGSDFNLRGEDVDIIDLSDFKKEYDGKSFRSFAKGGLVSKKNEVKTIDEQMNKLIQSGGVANYG